MTFKICMIEDDEFYWCGEIRKITKVPIIFMSARAEDYDQVRAIMSGGDDYVTKPFSHMNFCLQK